MTEHYDKHTTDPLERAIAVALDEAGIRYGTDRDGTSPANLDFHLPDYDLYIEVKGGHTDRISEQMSRHFNVIVVQGSKSTKFLAKLLSEHGKTLGN